MTRILTHERLTEVLDYDPATGVFTWKARLSRKFPIGRVAGGARNGTLYIRIDESDYTCARLAWFYVTGKWPHRMKFVDDDKMNVRFDNLVETHALPKKYDHSTPEGRSAYLAAHRERHPRRWKDAQLKSAFGISLDDYEAMHTAQEGCCAICRKPETGLRYSKQIKLAVDHNHMTGAVRDLLCRGCNQLIGNAKEDVATLEAAISYLRRHSGVPFATHHPFHADADLMLH